MKGLTEIVFILDRSGSMSGLEADTIGGFNSLINKQKKEPGEALISTILFDDEIQVLHNRIPLEKIPPMTEDDYYVCGCTALLDAVGSAAEHIAEIHRNMDKRAQPEKTVFIITTDGMENASRTYTYDKVKEIIERQKKRFGWEFLFLGANIDAADTAGQFGISPDHAANFHCDSVGTAINYQVLSDAIVQVRACEPLDVSWKKKIDLDFESRKKQNSI